MVLSPSQLSLFINQLKILASEHLPEVDDSSKNSISNVCLSAIEKAFAALHKNIMRFIVEQQRFAHFESDHDKKQFR